MLYSSTIVGPAGPHFVDLEPAVAFQRLIGTRFEPHGSDQRADWIGNLLMLVPFGFLAGGVIWPKRRGLKLPAALAAVLVCFMAIVVIKYLQLFFPPRTVTLNYIAAQTLGAAAGCCCFALWRERFAGSMHAESRIAALVMGLRLYFIALVAFLLMPLDFVLDAEDLRSQIDRLPATIMAPPGGEGSLAQRVMVIAVAAAAFVPVGMLLTLVKRGVHYCCRGILAVAGYGLLITTGCYLLATLVISAAPVMSSILYRTCGIIAGAVVIRWLAIQDTDRLRHRLRALVPWAVLPYVVCLVVANRLLSIHWLSMPDAVAHVYPLGLLPLFDYYIVSKAAAARNIVGHAVLYMPVGVLLWLRYDRQASLSVFITATALSFSAELARYFRPGLQGDINAVLVAGLAAMLAAWLMPMLWSMLDALGSRSAPPGQSWAGRGLPHGEKDVPWASAIEMDRS